MVVKTTQMTMRSSLRGLQQAGGGKTYVWLTAAAAACSLPDDTPSPLTPWVPSLFLVHHALEPTPTTHPLHPPARPLATASGTWSLCAA